MKCPTKEQIQKAGNKSKYAREALEKLFPKAFSPVLKAGQIYSWGTNQNGGSGLVIEHPSTDDGFAFINLSTGSLYISFLHLYTTKNQLNDQLKKLNPKDSHHGYQEDIRGPEYFKSWWTK